MPLWRYFAESIRALREDRHRHLVIAALLTVTAGYVPMFVTVFDYSRWISNWAVCTFLLLHVVKTLPVAREVVPISTDDDKANICGLVLTLVPRVGTIRPF